jgi:DNA-directed RNA polymerase specialized sigma24 family protein
VKADATDLPPPAPVPVAAPAPADAVTALYRAHALRLIRLAVVMLGDRPAAEDAFCGLYRRWHHLSDPGKAPAAPDLGSW